MIYIHDNKLKYLLFILCLFVFSCDELDSLLGSDDDSDNVEITCEDNYTQFFNYGNCYFNDDIEVLNSFIDNSLALGGLNYDLDDSNNDGEISWNELCFQVWDNSRNKRLIKFSVFTGEVVPENNCNLAGEIPENIGNWTELTYLDLGYHPDPDNTSGQLGGEIPQNLSNLTKLESLYLYNNLFEGAIPDIFNNMNNLKILWLCNNNFSGEVPQSIWNLSSLETMWIEDNSLIGQISPSISNLSSLKNIDLGRNSFSGLIPDELYNLNTLERIYLYDNQLTGNISENISNLTNLTTINLQNNLFYGALPDEICLLNIDYEYESIDSIYYLGYTWKRFNVENNNFCPEYPECISQDDIDSQDKSNCP